MVYILYIIRLVQPVVLPNFCLFNCNYKNTYYIISVYIKSCFIKCIYYRIVYIKLCIRILINKHMQSNLSKISYIHLYIRCFIIIIFVVTYKTFYIIHLLIWYRCLCINSNCYPSTTCFNGSNYIIILVFLCLTEWFIYYFATSLVIIVLSYNMLYLITVLMYLQTIGV